MNYFEGVRFGWGDHVPRCSAWINRTFPDFYALNFAAAGTIHGEDARGVRRRWTTPVTFWTRPGPRYQSDAELAEAHRRFGYNNYHACGTCRMGKDADAPVDPRLRVRGVEGVRVADTSIFPVMLAGNTQAPAMALAWRGADLIIEDTA